MKYLVILAVLLGVIFTISIGNTEAQLAGNKAFTLSGNGFAVTNTVISDSSTEITFSITQTKTKTDFALETGMITIDQKDMALSNLSGSILQNGKIFKFTAKATDPQKKEFTINAVGRLVDKTATDSIYTLSGTMSDSKNKITKLIYTGKVSEFTRKTTDKTNKSELTIQILKGAGGESTYIGSQSGTGHKFFSQDRAVIKPGDTITFVNQDTKSHNLLSGSGGNSRSSHKEFTPDGKISSGEIQPGKSWSVTFDEIGFYRIFDEKSQTDFSILVASKTTSIKSNTPYN